MIDIKNNSIFLGFLAICLVSSVNANLIFYDNFNNDNLTSEGWRQQTTIPNFLMTETDGYITGIGDNGGWILQNFTDLDIPDSITMTAIAKSNGSDELNFLEFGFAVDSFSPASMIDFRMIEDLGWSAGFDGVICNPNDSNYHQLVPNNTFEFHNYSVIFIGNTSYIYFDGILDGSVEFSCDVTSYSVVSLVARGNQEIVTDFYLSDCTTSFECSGYSNCINGTQNCNAVIDTNSCNIQYKGDYSEFEPQSCPNPIGYVSNYTATDLAPIAISGIGSFLVVLVSFASFVAIGVVAGYTFKWFKR